MDGKGRLGARNWEFSDHTARSVPENNASGYQAGFLKMSAYSDRNALISESNSGGSSMDFSWIPHRNFLSTTKSMTELQATQVSSEMVDDPNMPSPSDDALQNSQFEGKPTKIRKQQSSSKKINRIATKALRPKEPKKPSSVPKKKKENSMSKGKREKKSQADSVDSSMLDFSGVPAPVCSCTGVPRQCYRWGSGGWQSSCCTTSISEHPLPMSTTRPGARLAGRKMSIGAYGKLLQKLAAEGHHDLSYAVDLKDHWARHGTNKFVTIR